MVRESFGTHCEGKLAHIMRQSLGTYGKGELIHIIRESCGNMVRESWYV